jgi:hypothetical protein
VWLDFRDAFGVVWALRVADRFNATAQICGWPVRLGWHGLNVDRGLGEANQSAQSDANSTSPAALAGEIGQQMQSTLATLLRRFVSPEWIEQRWRAS